MGTLVPWLGGRVCVSVFFPALQALSTLLLPVVLLGSDFDEAEEDCTSLLLSGGDTWLIRPLKMPSTQRIFILYDTFWSIKFSSLEGRQAVISICNGTYFYVKTEFETNMRKISGGDLLKNLTSSRISKKRTVILGTYNCTIYSAFGPLHKGKPDWIDGVELLGVTSLLNSAGLKWSIYPSYGMGRVYPDGTLEEGKLKWNIKNGLVDIGFCAFWTSNAVLADVINPWQRSCTRLLVPRPRNINPDWHTVFHPLPLEFWLILIVFNLCTAAVISALASTSPYMKSQNKEAREIWDTSTEEGVVPKLNARFGENWYQALTFITHGIGNNQRVKRGLHTLQVAWGLFILISSAAYSSSLSSILTTPAEEEVPQTLEELLAKGFFWASGIEPLVNPEYYFQTQSGLDEEWLKFRIYDGKIIKGKTAILGEELNGIFTMTKANEYSIAFLDTLMVSNECLGVNHISILTRKMSPYYEFISAGFSRLAETGVLMKMLSDGLMSPQIKKYIVQNRHKEGVYPRGIKLGLPPLRGAFYILIVGHLMASATLLFELFKSHKKN